MAALLAAGVDREAGISMVMNGCLSCKHLDSSL